MMQPSEFYYDVASGLSQGRRERQEDTIAIDFPVGMDHGFAVLSDGMGGHNAGDLASGIVVTEIFSALKLQPLSSQDFETEIKRTLCDAVSDANLCLEHVTAQHEKQQVMGATLLAPVLFADRLYWISVGDSPLFLFRKGALTRLNEVHSVQAEIDALLDKGQISALEAANHPDRECLTSVLMGRDIPKIDCAQTPLELRDNDIVLAASDGLEFLEEDQIAAVIGENQSNSSAEISAALLNEIRSLDDPEQDNVSLCVIKRSRLNTSKPQEPANTKQSSMTFVSAKVENGASIYRISRKVTA
ncbi:MAG: protein phosphatase 2C domain-containing protein [Pseudomonadota bacterium]